MKKLLKGVSLVVLSFAFFNATAGTPNPIKRSLLAPQKANSDKAITDGGAFFHISGFLPSGGYMIPRAFSSQDISDLYSNDFPRYGLGIDLELGNMIQLADFNNMAIGLRFTWFNANIATRRFNDTTAIRTITASMFRVGPYYTYAFNDKMAADIFYQLGPQAGISLDHYYSDWDGEIIGLSHEIGLGYRFDKLSVILAYRFGTLTDISGTPEARRDPDFRDFYRNRVGGLRFGIGVKL
jgi:hypothetical protein